MKYLIWQSDNDDDSNKDKDKLLKVLPSNRSFAEVFEGSNPLHPVGDIIKMHHKKYRITKFKKVKNMVKVDVVVLAVKAA